MKYVLFLTILLITTTVDSQDLKTHQWKNRIMVVLSNDADSKEYKTQISDLKQDQDGCVERKLFLYQVLPNQFVLQRFDGTKSDKWNETSDLYKEFMRKNEDFKMVLIGLDGTIKEERNEPITTEELFEIIDGMSMRQAEMRKDQ